MRILFSLFLLWLSATSLFAQRLPQPWQYVSTDSIVVWLGGGLDLRDIAYRMDGNLATPALSPRDVSERAFCELRNAWDAYDAQINIAGGLGNPFTTSQILAAANNLYLAAQMLAFTGEAAYADVIERAAYNALLRAAVFPEAARERHVAAQALLAALGTSFATCEDGVAVSAFHNATAHVQAPGLDLVLDVMADVPFKSRVKLRINAVKATAPWTLRLRIPEWATHQALYSFYLNGHEVHPVLQKGYATLTRTWRSGDEVFFDLPVAPQVIRGTAYVGPFLYFDEAHPYASLPAEAQPQVDEQHAPFPFGLPALTADSTALVPYCMGTLAL